MPVGHLQVYLKVMNSMDILKALSDQATINLVFICSGNVMRSPYAEMLFEKYVNERQASGPRIKCESLAVTYRNSTILSQTYDLLIENGVSSQRIAQFTPRYIDDYLEVCQNADLIFGMTEDHLKALASWQEKTFLLSKFVNGPNAEEIPDPFFTKDVWKAYAMVKENVEGLIALFNAAGLIGNLAE